MFSKISRVIFLMALMGSCGGPARVLAQEPPAQQEQKVSVPEQDESHAAKAVEQPAPLILPAGTKLPLVLRNGINTRTAKPGDSVYFETAYPIAQNNRILIPMGSFARGHLLEAKRPGRVKGRGEFRMMIESVTLPNGYTFSLAATPSSLDTNGREGVDKEGKIVGPSSVGRDAATVVLATAVGGPVGTYAGGLAGGSLPRSTAIGHGAGFAAGLAVVLLTRGREAELSRGMTMDVVLDHDVALDPAYATFTNLGKDLTPPVPPTDHCEEILERSRGRMERRRLPIPYSLLFGGLPF